MNARATGLVPAEEAGTARRDGGTQCIHRSMGVMRLLSSSSADGVKLVEIADALQLSRPTAHRILKALEEEGMVERVPGSRRYTVGAEVPWLGLPAVNRFPIMSVCGPVLDRLAESVTDSILLTVRSRDDTIYADRRLGCSPMQATRLSAGTRRPLGVSVAGRAILGWLSDQKRQEVVTENAVRFSRFGCTPEEVLEAARTARQNGYLSAPSLVARHKQVLAVPILDVVGAPVAALSVIAARARMHPARVAQLVPMLRAASQEMSDALWQKAARSA